MVNPKKLVQMAKKWQRAVINKGNFVAYSSDRKRFMIPLAYLESSIFVQLFKMSEDEFGLPSDGPITLPCDSVAMEYILSLLRIRGSKAADQWLLNSLFKHHHSCSLNLVGSHQQVVSSF